MDYTALDAVSNTLAQAVWSPSSCSDATATLFDACWARLGTWLRDSEPAVRGAALRALDGVLLGANVSLRTRSSRVALARTLVDAAVGDEVATLRAEACSALGRLCCVTGDEWMVALAYPVLRSALIATLPHAWAKPFFYSDAPAGVAGTQVGAGQGQPGPHRRSPSVAAGVDRSPSPAQSRSPSPLPSASPSARGALPSTSSGLLASQDPVEREEAAGALIQALDSFGFLLDSPAARDSREADVLDDLFLTILASPDADLFVKSQLLILLSTQLRHSYRNRRRIMKLLPQVKAIMTPPYAAPASGRSSTGATHTTDKMHPYLMRTVSLFIATWWWLPPDRLLRRFPAPSMLKGYAARQFHKITAGASAAMDTSPSASRHGHRKNESSAFGMGRPGGSSISAEVYSLLDTDQLGWASNKTVDQLLTDLHKWAARKALLNVRDAAGSSDGPPDLRNKSSLPSHRKGGVDRGRSVSVWSSTANASISLTSASSSEEDFVNELLAQWGDVSFNLRADQTVSARDMHPPAAAISSPIPGKGQIPSFAKSISLASPSAPTAESILAQRQTRSIRSRTLEFDAKHSVRELTLSNKSTRHAHDFFLQLEPGWAFVVEPAWGHLAPGASKQIRVRFHPSPLDLAGTKIGGYLRVRSVHGFALERVELLGWTGPSLRVLHACGGAAQDQLVHVNPSSTVAIGSGSSVTLSTPQSSSASSVLDFGICFLGVSKTQYLYVQNVSAVSTQASVIYQAPTNTASTASKPGATNQPAAFSVIPSLLFLRPHETKRVSVIFYPTTIKPIMDSNIVILGLGEESYTFRLAGRGGIPLKLQPSDTLDFGAVEKWNASAKELAKEMTLREMAESDRMSGSMQPLASVSSITASSVVSSTPRAGIYREWLTVINYNQTKSLPVSFRYSGQKHSMPSDGSDSHHTHASGTAGVSSFANHTQMTDFDVLYIKDAVIPPGSTQRIPITLVAQNDGSFSRRVYVNTPLTPTDSLSILVTAHVGPLLRVGNTAVVHMPPVGANSAAHHVLPIVNLSKYTLTGLEVQGLKRTPVYFAISRMPSTLAKPQPPRQVKRAIEGEEKEVTPLPAPAEELNDYFDPAFAFTCAIPNTGKDFLPAPIPLADFTTGYLSQFHDMAFTIRPYETLLLHMWFITHMQGFYVIPFQLRIGGAFANTYGPIEIKAVCLARSTRDTEFTPFIGDNEGLAVAIHPAEDSDNVNLLKSALDSLQTSGLQYRGDVSSVSFQPLKRFSSCPGNKGVVGGFNLNPDGGGAAMLSKSYASEFVAVPSDKYDESLRNYVVPMNEGGSERGNEYVLYRTPVGTAFGSTAFKLPPRLWLWNRKTLLLMLTNLSSSTQAFHCLLTFPFNSTFCTEIEKNAEYSATDGSLLPLSSSASSRRNREAPNRLAAFKSAKIDVSLLSMEEWAGQKAANEAALERARAAQERAEREEAEDRMMHPGRPPRPRRGSYSAALAEIAESMGEEESTRGGKRYRPHEIATGYLGVIDERNHLSVCQLRGMIGHLVSIETPPRNLVFNCTTPNNNAPSSEWSSSGIPPANPVTLYIKLHNHSDLNVQFGFKFGSAASEVLSPTVPTVSSGFSMLKPVPSVLSAYETRFVPITFSPQRVGKLQSEFVAFYKNPYQPSERFEFFTTKLVGNYISEAMVEFEGEGSAVKPANVAADVSSHTSFIDCGTVIVPTAPATPVMALVPYMPATAATPSSSKELPFTLHNTSSQELMVTAQGFSPFFINLPEATGSGSSAANANSAAENTAAASTGSATEDAGGHTLTVPGGPPTGRRNWAERRAARLRQKSGMSYVLDESGGTPGSGSGAFTFADEKSISSTSLIPAAVSQLLLALNSVHFNVAFRPAPGQSGAFASQLIVSFLHYFKLIDCFGWAGKLQLHSNWGAPTSTTDIAPTALAKVAGTKQEQTKSDAPQPDNTPPSAARRFSMYGGGLRTGHHRDASAPTVAPQASPPAGGNLLQLQHARHASVLGGKNAMGAGTTAAAASAASGVEPQAIDLGLSPLKRLLKKSLTISNTGSMPIYIGRIDIVNAQGGVAGGAFQTANAAVMPQSSKEPHLTARQGGMTWSFAHTTIVRGASNFQASTPPMSPSSPSAHSSGTTKEFRQHTIVSVAGAAPGLNVHARSPLNATLLKSNKLSNSQRKRRMAQIRNGTFDSVKSMAPQLGEGFVVEDLDANAVDWDEVDYQLEVQNLTFSAAEAEASANASENEAKRRTTDLLAAAARARGTPRVDQSESADADEDEEVESSAEELSQDFPIVLHPGHSLPLTLCYYKEKAGTYLHEVQVSCIDPSIATAAAAIAATAAATVNPTPADVVAAKMNRTASLNSPMYIGTATMMTVLGADNKRALPAASTAYPTASAQLLRAAAQGDFSSWSPDELRSLIFKSFSFLFRVSAQEVLKIEGGFREMDFGIINCKQLAPAMPAGSPNSLTTPSPSGGSFSYSAPAVSASRPMTFAFVNEGSIPLHWKLIKMHVQLSRVASDQKSDGAGDGEEEVEEFIDEDRAHEGAFILSPSVGLLQPKQRQIVTVVFAPQVAHLKYVWHVALQTVEMSHNQSVKLFTSGGPNADATLLQLVGVAGSSSLQLMYVDEQSGHELPLPSNASGGSELSFGCISIGSDRHKKFLLRNSGEIASTFELKNSSQRFHIIPTQGTVPPHSVLELHCSFQPQKAKFYSTSVTCRWGSAIGDGAAADEDADSSPLLQETLRLLITGKGGVCDLHVPDPVVDFGTVTIHQEHILLMRIQNLGGAEGEATVEIDSDCVRLKDPDAEMFVPPGGHLDVAIVFSPRTLAPLNLLAIVRCTTSPSYQQSVTLKGLVGVPNVVIEPSGILDYLDYGTCLTNTQRTIEFSLINMGNVDIKFEVVFLRLKSAANSVAGGAPKVRAAGRPKLNKKKTIAGTDMAPTPDPGGVEQFPSLTRVRHTTHGHKHSQRISAALFPGGQVGASATTNQNELFYEDHADELEEYVPTALSIYPTSGRVSAAAPPLGSPVANGATSGSNRVTMALTFSPTQSLEVLETALLIRSTHNVAHSQEEERENRNVSAFDSLYAIVRGLAGEQKLVIDTVARHIDFGICRIGQTYTKTMVLSNPGNIRVDYHIGPDLDNDPTWRNYSQANVQQHAALASPLQTPLQSPMQSPLQSPAIPKGDLAMLDSATVSNQLPAVDYSNVRKLWLESFNSLGFDLVYSGEVLPGRTSTVSILYTPREEAHVAVKVRIVSNARLENIDIEGSGATSQLMLFRTKNIRLSSVHSPEHHVDHIDFGLLPIVPSHDSGDANSSSYALQAVSPSAYRKIYWVFNSGNLSSSFLISRNDIPPEFDVRPMEATVPPNQFLPITITFNPARINHPINFMLKFLGTASIVAAGKHGVALLPSPKPQLSVKVSGSGGFGILGVCFLNDADATMRGLDFDIVSVHSQHMVEKYVSLYNCGSVPLRIKVEVDNSHYSVGIAGAISSLSMQIVDVVSSTPIDEDAIHNEIRYNAKLNRYHVTNTHHVMRKGPNNKLLSPIEKPIGQSAFDYEEAEDGTLEKASRASLMTYLIAGTAALNAGGAHPDEPGRSRRGSLHGLEPGGNALLTDAAGVTVPIPSLGEGEHVVDASDSTAATKALMAGLASSNLTLTHSTTSTNPLTANLVGTSVVEEVLMPGKYIPFFVRLLVAEEKSYMCTLTVASEHNFISIPVRAEGGIVNLSHSGTLDFGTIGTFHRYTKTIILRNTGTVPTRAKLFWNIRGNGQDESGGSNLALSGPRAFTNPFIDSDEEEEEESSDEEAEEALIAAETAAAVKSGDSAIGTEAEEAEKAARVLRLVQQRAARVQRKAAREARRRDKAAANERAKPLKAVDTYKSIIRLYAPDDVPPTQLNITRLWWQHCIKFIRILLRSYKMMYPQRAKKLFVHQNQNAMENDDDFDDEGALKERENEKAETQQKSAADEAHSRRSRSRALPAGAGSRPRSGSRSRGRADSPGADVKKAPGGGGLEEYLIEMEKRKTASVAAALKHQRENEEEARLRTQEQRIKLAVIKVAEMDPALREHMGGSALDNNSVDEAAAAKERGSSTFTIGDGRIDSEVGLPTSHPMYASAMLLAQKGKIIENNVKTLVQKVHHRFNDGDNPALMELLAAGARLNLKMAHKKLPRIGDPGDGIVDMRTAESADRVPQLRLSPSTMLLSKDSRVEVQVDVNVPRAGHFNATLIVECELAGVERYEIPLRAIAAQVNFLFDDNSKLDFGRLPLGETELRTRTLTNLGEIPVKFRVENENPGLTVSPMDGVIAPGRRKPFAFTFRPVDESVQNLPIRIYTSCTPTLTLQVFGSGGVPKLHMDNFERLDFGRCMIGKSQTRLLKLTNTGNANLPILKASLEESVVFHKGLRAHAERDAKEQLMQRSGFIKDTTSPHGADNASTQVEKQQPKRRRRRASGTAGKELTGVDDSFGLSKSSIANASKGQRVRRSIYVPAGGKVSLIPKRAMVGSSSLGLNVPPALEEDSDSDDEVDLAAALEDDEDLEGVDDEEDEEDGDGADDDMLEHFGHNDWPEGRFIIEPGDSLELPIQFRPPKEDIFIGHLVIESLSQAYHIELVGTGREALLVYDQKIIEFQECLVGSSYTKEFSLMNVGEVKYPVKLILQDKTKPAELGSPSQALSPVVPGRRGGQVLVRDPSQGLSKTESALAAALRAAAEGGSFDGDESKENESTDVVRRSPRTAFSFLHRRPISNFDLKVSPEEIVLAAFEKKIITVTYTPSREMKCSAKLILDSVYSHNVIAVHMLAGTATLELSTHKIDFGLVEQGHKVSSILTLKNTGTLPLAYRIKPPSSKPFHTLPFNFSRWTGVVGAGLEVDIMCRAHLMEIGQFCEELCIETERVGQRYFFTVSGQCAKSFVDPSKFQVVNFGPSQVGEPVSQVIAICNEGGYPLDFDMKFNYPLSVTPKSGRIPGNTTQTFQVQWVPTGGYDMRSVVHMDTNIGVFDISVRGVGAYPRFVLRDAYIDFGVGAFWNTYRKKFGIINKGKVAIAWSIPAVDAGYTVEPESGLLGAGEECEVVVAFTPTRVGIYHGNFIVESKGRYREVSVVGIGGILSLDYPELVDMESCACGQWQSTVLCIQNTGDVTLNMKARLDRTSIDAEPNTDDEEDEEQKQPVEEDLPSEEHRQRAHIELIDDEELQRNPIDFAGPIVTGATAEDAEVAGVVAGSTVISEVSSAHSRMRRYNQPQLGNRSAIAQFVVKSYPSTLIIPPRTNSNVVVRTFVPADARGPFSFRLLLKAVEATLSVYFSGVATEVTLSNYARTLLLADRNSVLAITRAPHPLQADTITWRRSDTPSFIARSNVRLLTAPDAEESTHVLLGDTLSHQSLRLDMSAYRRQQLRLLQQISEWMAASERDLDGRSMLPRRRKSPNLQLATADASSSSSAPSPAPDESLLSLDDDVIACHQCLDSIVTAVSVAMEHASLLREVEAEAQETLPFTQAAMRRLFDPTLAPPLFASALDADPSVSLSRDVCTVVPSSVLAWPHAPGSHARQIEWHAGDSGTGRSRVWQQVRHTEVVETPANVHERKQSADVSSPSPASSDIAVSTSPTAEVEGGIDGVLVSVFGVTHVIDASLHAPLTLGIDDVASTLLRCEPELPPPAHSALLRPIEPHLNVEFARTILPDLLADPPDILAELSAL